eukprot:815530-Amphidinium_carterae.1
MLLGALGPRIGLGGGRHARKRSSSSESSSKKRERSKDRRVRHASETLLKHDPQYAACAPCFRLSGQCPHRPGSTTSAFGAAPTGFASASSAIAPSQPLGRHRLFENTPTSTSGQQALASHQSRLLEAELGHKVKLGAARADVVALLIRVFGNGTGHLGWAVTSGIALP